MWSKHAATHAAFGEVVDVIRDNVVGLAFDTEALMAYARQSADMMYALHCGFGKGVASIALVQGRCVGGGFETAVACDYIFAERHSEFSFPDMRSSQRGRCLVDFSMLSRR